MPRTRRSTGIGSCWSRKNAVPAGSFSMGPGVEQCVLHRLCGKMSRMGGVAIVVFSDLVDSTALLATLGDDRMERVRRAHVEDVTAAVNATGGRVVKTLGDGMMASFDSALGALRAAARIQAAVEELDSEHGELGIAARVGVAAGEPIPDGDDLHGMTVVIASRLSSAAGTGEVLVQDLVQALVASRDGVELEAARDYELKGVPAPVRASCCGGARWRQVPRMEPARFPGPPRASRLRTVGWRLSLGGGVGVVERIRMPPSARCLRGGGADRS